MNKLTNDHQALFSAVRTAILSLRPGDTRSQAIDALTTLENVLEQGGSLRGDVTRLKAETQSIIKDLRRARNERADLEYEAQCLKLAAISKG